MRTPLDVQPAIDRLDEAAPRLVGRSAAMAAVRARVEAAAATRGSVLIRGETGTGKGLVARRIHAISCGPAAPFVTILCPALPREPTNFPGLLAAARGGSLLLDEVADMPLGDQDLVLGALQACASATAGADGVRCLATTRADLTTLSRLGRFRAELHAALAVVQVDLPPLRTRLADLPELIEAFLEKAEARGSCRQGRRPSLTAGALAALGSHTWPGNVLELENVLERVVVAAPGQVIDENAIVGAVATGPLGRASHER